MVLIVFLYLSITCEGREEADRYRRSRKREEAALITFWTGDEKDDISPELSAILAVLLRPRSVADCSLWER